MNEQPSNIRDWLAQHAAGDIPLHLMARALGVHVQKVEELLQAAPTAEALLNLNRLAQYRYLALTNRVWPDCPWLAWDTKRDQQPATIDLILGVFGQSLLDNVAKTFGEDVVRQYWIDLEIPPEYEDILLDDEVLDPFADVPEEQIVDSPHFDEDEDEGEFFVFGHPATAACFLWLIETRANYSHYVYNTTGYHHDPLGIQLAYNLRRVLKREYWAPLPPDTVSAYLAIARALQVATVPDEYREGRLSPLYTVEVATLPTDRLDIVQVGDEEMWLYDNDLLRFDRQPIHVFTLEAQTDETPAALILTTQTEPGNPEQHRSGLPYHYLHRSGETDLLALVPREQTEYIRQEIGQVEEVIEEASWGKNYALHAETGIFCVCRFNSLLMSKGYGELIPVYRIPGGYMLQFNPEYTFNPQEMAVG